MKIILIIGLLLIPAWAQAQKTCVNAANSQACTVTLTVTPPTSDLTHGPATSMQIRRRDGSGTMGAIGSPLPVGGPMSMQNVFTDSGNVPHCFDVIATNAKGDSMQSTEACWTTPAIIPGVPNIPGPPQISQIQRDRMTISWKDNSNNEDGFEVLRMRGSTVSVIGTTPRNVVSLTDTGLQPSTTYRYQVAAFNVHGRSVPTKQVTARTRR